MRSAFAFRARLAQRELKYYSMKTDDLEIPQMAGKITTEPRPNFSSFNSIGTWGMLAFQRRSINTTKSQQTVAERVGETNEWHTVLEKPTDGGCHHKPRGWELIHGARPERARQVRGSFGSRRGGRSPMIWLCQK